MLRTKKLIRKTCFGSHTCFRTEAEAFVHIVVLSSGAPAVAIVPAGRGAAVISLSLKGEGEFTRCPLSVTTQGEENCEKMSENVKLLYRFLLQENQCC